MRDTAKDCWHCWLLRPLSRHIGKHMVERHREALYANLDEIVAVKP